MMIVKIVIVLGIVIVMKYNNSDNSVNYSKNSNKSSNNSNKII